MGFPGTDKKRGLRQSFRDAWRGLSYAFSTQRNFRWEVLIAVAVIAVLPSLPLTFAEAAGAYFFVVLVLLAELINTAVEKAVDRISPEFHPVAGIAKDVSAGAVLLVATAALIYALVILLRIWR
ncbi:MAG TPA: diacylglycerol kinase family protein [Candidatus Moranbacteria bacterium]|nr:diacylglycerol kinase family protein [Candidatus Moranbacteria bacterium]